MPLGFPINLWAEVVDHVSRALPCEACGFLSGRSGLITGVHPVENALHSPTAYRMEPANQVRTMTAIERQGREIVAIFHSHPDGPTHPSPTDLTQATYPDVLYVICSPAGPDRAWSARAFWLRDGQALEEPIDWLTAEAAIAVRILTDLSDHPAALTDHNQA